MAVTINGDGVIDVGGNASSAAYVRLYEDSDNGTNYVDLIAPASVASNRTLTMPDASGTIDRLNRAGNVLQVVNANVATSLTISTTTLTDTGLTASITPTSASSKVLVLVNLIVGLNRQTNSAVECKAQLLRGGTQILNMGETNGLGFRIGAGTDSIGRITMAATMSLSYLDSPATTSSTTYKMQAAPSTTNNNGIVTINWGSDVNSTITLMEIAA